MFGAKRKRLAQCHDIAFLAWIHRLAEHLVQSAVFPGLIFGDAAAGIAQVEEFNLVQHGLEGGIHFRGIIGQDYISAKMAAFNDSHDGLLMPVRGEI